MGGRIEREGNFGGGQGGREGAEDLHFGWGEVEVTLNRSGVEEDFVSSHGPGLKRGSKSGMNNGRVKARREEES